MMAKTREYAVRLARLTKISAGCVDCSWLRQGEGAQAKATAHVRQTGHRVKATRVVEVSLSPGAQTVPDGQLALPDS
jgi:hypothetical protein